jgi:energy-coupling factor transporter ATP-binding protein EcfA2
METDLAFEKFAKICAEIKDLENIETEADTRFQIIDRFVVGVLNWERDSIKLEPHLDSGYADYLLKNQGENKLVIEAKRSNESLIDTKATGKSSYKVSGPSLRSCIDGLKQAQRYCVDTGVIFSGLTNGFQWIGFWAIRDDGKPPFEGKAIVFPTLESIEENFAVFYDLFSREGVDKNLYKAHIKEVEGFKIVTTEKFESVVKPNEINIIKRSSLASDIDVVFQRFFSDISGDDDPEMLANCFVESRESRESEVGLEKIARNLIGEIDVLTGSDAGELRYQIEQSVQMEKGDFVLIIGNKGAGKTTFIDRFFRIVIDRSLRSKCLVLRVNLADSDGDTNYIAQWLTNKLLSTIEDSIYKNINPSYDELQGIFYSEYSRWRDGEYKHLYLKDKESFKIKFGEYIHQLKESETHRYVIKLLQSVVRSRKLLPCIIFDNADHYPQRFQEAVFQFAQSINRAVMSFVICPITDRTVWQLSKHGPLQSYDCHSFYLPIPQTKEILQKRVSYLKIKVEEESNKEKKDYNLSKGLRLKITDISHFAACIDEIFIKSEFVSRIIGWLSNHDIRRSLKIAQKVITSPIIPIVDLIKTWASDERLPISEMKIRQAILYGQYNMFNQENSEYILNLFVVDPLFVSTPLLKLSILILLRDIQSSANSGEQEYAGINEIKSYFSPCGISNRIVNSHFNDLLRYRLVEPYNPTDDRIYDSQRVRITHCGRIHIEFALRGYIYLQNMALVTPIRDFVVVDQIKSLMGGKKMDRDSWTALKSTFASYLLDEDDKFFSIPEVSQYEGQKNLRNEFRRSWVREGTCRY